MMMLSTSPYSLAFSTPPTFLSRRVEQKQQIWLSSGNNDDATTQSSSWNDLEDVFFFVPGEDSNQEDPQVHAVRGPDMKQAMEQRGWKKVNVCLISSLDELPSGEKETEEKADSTKTDLEMDTALQKALMEIYTTEELRLEALQTLVAGGACIQRSNAMLRAAGDVRNLQVLVKLGGSVHARDKWGSTPLHIAAVFNNAEAVEFLLQEGAYDLKEAKDNDGLTSAEVFEKSMERKVSMELEFGVQMPKKERENLEKISSLLGL
jgi:ankyrin repeat protein